MIPQTPQEIHRKALRNAAIAAGLGTFLGRRPLLTGLGAGAIAYYVYSGRLSV